MIRKIILECGVTSKQDLYDLDVDDFNLMSHSLDQETIHNICSKIKEKDILNLGVVSEELPEQILNFSFENSTCFSDDDNPDDYQNDEQGTVSDEVSNDIFSIDYTARKNFTLNLENNKVRDI